MAKKQGAAVTYRHVLAKGLDGLIAPLLCMSDGRLGTVSKKITGLLCNEDYAPDVPVDLFPISLELAARLDRHAPGQPSVRGAFFSLAKKRCAWLLAFDEEDAGWLMRNIICDAAGRSLVPYTRDTLQRDELEVHLESVLKNLSRPVRDSVLDLQDSVEDAMDTLSANNLMNPEDSEFMSGMIMLDHMQPFSDDFLREQLQDPHRVLTVLVARELLEGTSIEDTDVDGLFEKARDIVHLQVLADLEPAEESREYPDDEFDDEEDMLEDDDLQISMQNEEGW